MNWDAIAAVSEFIAALAVVISLIYIAAQVTSGAKALKTSLRESSFHNLMEYNYALFAEKDLGWIFQQGMRDLDLLDERDRARAIHVMYAFFKLFENMYLHFIEGSIDEQVWSTNKQLLLIYVPLKGAQHYLTQRMPIFDPRFQQLLKTLEPTSLPAGHLLSKLGDQISQKQVE